MQDNICHDQNRGESACFNRISEFWTRHPNNKIYLRNHPSVAPGTKEYFKIILAARRKYIYYFNDMLDWLEQSPSKNLLEVGSGMGTDALLFAQQGFTIAGIDLSPAHIELAEQLFALYSMPGYFVKGNAEHTPFSDNCFGCVFSFGVLHHTPDTAKAIKEVHRILVPSGRAVLMLYHRRSLNNFVHWFTRKGFENFSSKEDAPVTQRFTIKEVKQMCSEFKVCNIQIEYLYGAGYGRIYDHTPKALYNVLSKMLGWHLVVYLEK
jgi:ubiquinone/menaquinone biosynthesis C-methylase UbiE